MPLKPHKKSGQAILFLLAVLLIGTVAVLWNFNLHRSIVTKLRMRDAGDSAALMGARWQGITLNVVGELNLVQAMLAAELVAGVDDDELYDEYAGSLVDYLGDELQGIQEIQRRLRGQGALAGFAAAQQMILNNRIYANDSWGASYDKIADYIYVVAEAQNDEAGKDYAATLGAIADNGVAAKTIPAREPYILWDAGLYNAIDAAMHGNWCQFFMNDTYLGWLNSYTSPSDWPDLPDDAGYSILGLDLEARTISLRYLVEEYRTNATVEVADDVGDLTDYLDDTGVDGVAYAASTVSAIPIKWTIYGGSWYNSWTDFAVVNSLPFRSDFRSHFDYMGPESIFEINQTGKWAFEETDGGSKSIVDWNSQEEEWDYYSFDELSDKAANRGETSSRNMRWVSAAKTFGALDVGSETYTPAYFGLVLPCFDNVRLIPVQRHVPSIETDPLTDFEHYSHIYYYVTNDDSSALDPYCPYCKLLIQFEDASFRAEGQEWVSDSDNTEGCADSYGAAGGGSSGAPFGH